MPAAITDLKKEVDRLVLQGELLYFAMCDKLGLLSDNVKKEIDKASVKLPVFQTEYET